MLRSARVWEKHTPQGLLVHCFFLTTSPTIITTATLCFGSRVQQTGRCGHRESRRRKLFDDCAGRFPGAIPAARGKLRRPPRFPEMFSVERALRTRGRCEEVRWAVLSVLRCVCVLHSLAELLGVVQVHVLPDCVLYQRPWKNTTDDNDNDNNNIENMT